MKRVKRGLRQGVMQEAEYLSVGELRDAIRDLPDDATIGISNGDFHVEASGVRLSNGEFAIEID